MIGIDLFSGSGGMTLGATLAGVKVKAAVEMNAAACKTYRSNHPSISLIEADLRTLENIDVGKRSEDLIIFGGPPCQGFSTSNQRTRNAANLKNSLYMEFVRLVSFMRPEWVVFENVAGILQTEAGFFSEAFQESLHKLGYEVCDALLNAAEYGCPQRRTRYFVVGALGRRPPDFPIPALDATPTLLEAIGDLPSLMNGASVDVLPYSGPPQSAYAASLRGQLEACSGHLVSCNADHIVARYSYIPQGGNWRNVPGMMRDGHDDRRRYHSGIYRRLREDEPSVVIGNFRKNMLIHPREDRGLSVREAARLQSFPDEYVFCGSIGHRQQQVGNAVPPMLARRVFERIMACSQGSAITDVSSTTLRGTPPELLNVQSGVFP
ncbi:DNA (cytosine-5-)-methyltransferase [Methylobacterium terrae]|uniref:DNA (cytosine-5-)-methyltransferase n=1 Tax=Methylobacterium terrae TaxID=2202827 RepID=A0A2U8WTE1_9HYPH|nr:DNA cytosine methyltransferase [Methylobacterium terrae]AWN49343.1 DNA (cytosine-5-)-methyltransferase [Methylobacterium terrae]